MPSAAAKVVRMAIAGGDPQTLLAALAIAPQGQVMAHDAYYKLQPEQRAQYGSPEAMMA